MIGSIGAESRYSTGYIIENFSDLGSGIHIAMQDLDIRGAGNMLGAEQSGFIADLGYEKMCIRDSNPAVSPALYPIKVANNQVITKQPTHMSTANPT